MVSIIVCTYNDAHLITPAIRSCFEQDTEVDVIVVDDASTNPFPPKVKRILTTRKNIRYIKHNKNQGLSAARNTGIAAAKFEKVIPLDADDYFFPNVLGTLERELDDATDVAYGNLFIKGNVDYPCAQPFTMDLMKARNPLFSSSLFKKKTWKKVGGYLVRNGPHYEDWNLWNKFFLVGAVFKYVDILVYEHVERIDSMLRKLDDEHEKYVKVATECLYQ